MAEKGSSQGIAGATRSNQSFYRFLAINGSCMLLAALAYSIAPDFAYALTIWPFWIWSAVAMWLLLVGIRKRNWRLTVGCALAWGVLAYAFNSEVRALVRTVFLMRKDSGPGVSIVSLNCAGGSAMAAWEAMARTPDVVLLQESPSESEMREFKRIKKGDEWLTYDILAGPDASILVQGDLLRIALPKRTSNFVCARARLKRTGIEVLIVSLRLAPPVLRFDYWNPDCWRSYAESKAARREELEEILEFVEAQNPDEFVVVGGDFNTPPDPSIQRRLLESYSDAFDQAGRNYGATAVSGFPMVRIDQIWSRGPYRAAWAHAQATEHSDHLLAQAWLVPEAYVRKSH